MVILCLIMFKARILCALTGIATRVKRATKKNKPKTGFRCNILVKYLFIPTVFYQKTLLQGRF